MFWKVAGFSQVRWTCWSRCWVLPGCWHDPRLLSRPRLNMALRHAPRSVPQPSPVEQILDKDEYTLEELLDEDDIIQECKSLNGRLVAL